MKLGQQEKWIPGYEGKYFATWQGQIFRVFKNGKVRELKGCQHGNCWVVNLGLNSFQFNRIIWETFKGPIPTGYLVVRKISVLSENGMHNLKLSTKAKHGKKTGPTSRSKSVELLNDGGDVIDSWSSARKAAKDLFVSYQTVMDICNKKVKRRPIINVRWEKGYANTPA